MHYVDLDGFKKANDTWGHPTGDEILKIAAERMRGLVRKYDLVARLGGDEFAVLQSPAELARFKPDCRMNQFSDCSTEEIVNAYDNSILYTDHVLSEVIDLLKDNEERFTSSMIYMSDHGESLGENGLYLHAAPYFIAPEMQTHIPFVAWFSPEFASATGLDWIGLDIDCLKRGAAQPASHDNLFHTVLGMMMIATSAYDQTLDRFSACRRGTALSSGL